MTDRRIILYAEDYESLRKANSRLLTQEFPEIDVDSFEDGTSLVARLQQDVSKVGVVITDQEMPGETGLQIIGEYSTRDGFRQIPFILLYGGDEMIGKEAVRRGAFAYISKFSMNGKLLDLIKRALDFSGQEPKASSQ